MVAVCHITPQESSASVSAGMKIANEPLMYISLRTQHHIYIEESGSWVSKTWQEELDEEDV